MRQRRTSGTGFLCPLQRCASPLLDYHRSIRLQLDTTVSVFGRPAENLKITDESGYRDARLYGKSDRESNAVLPATAQRQQRERDRKQKPPVVGSDNGFEDSKLGLTVETQGIKIILQNES